MLFLGLHLSARFKFHDFKFIMARQIVHQEPDFLIRPRFNVDRIYFWLAEWSTSAN